MTHELVVGFVDGARDERACDSYVDSFAEDALLVFYVVGLGGYNLLKEAGVVSVIGAKMRINCAWGSANA